MVLTISVVIIAAVMVFTLAFQIPIFLQLYRTAQEVEKLIQTARPQISPLSQELAATVQKVNGILESVHRQVDKVEGGIGSIGEAATRLRDFEEMILKKIEEPLLELASLISALARGLEAFLHLVRR